VTARLGFGFGPAVDFDPHGGIPGGVEATGNCGGAVISASFKAAAGFGPFGGQYERGVYRNFTAGIIDQFSDKGPELSSEHEGLRYTVSGGVQVTLFRGLH
jgi:hypothetical protein